MASIIDTIVDNNGLENHDLSEKSRNLLEKWLLNRRSFIDLKNVGKL